MPDYTAHTDTFARDHLPPRELWPVMRYDTLPDLAYPATLNCGAELLDRAAGSADSRTALVFPGGTWSYEQLLGTANQYANVLVDDYGIEPGNRVLLRGYNGPVMVALWYAVLKAGGIVVCTMPLLRERELGYILKHAHVNITVCDARLRADLDAAVGSNPISSLCFGDGELEALAARKPTDFTNVQTAADDVAIIAYTSGTTGNAKGTVHFHRDILAICDCWSKYVLRPEANDLFCGSPPIAFTYGLGGLVLFPARVGASSLLLEQATPPQLVEAIAHYRPTISFTSPTAYRAMVPRVAQLDVSSLKKCVSAGETLPRATFDAWHAATGLEIIDGIGATEMLHIFISAAGNEVRPGSTGKVVPGYEARVVDDKMNDVPVGEIGRLAVRGPTGCRYLADEERQRTYVRNGWNLTGDAYKLDADGYFWYQARTDDMIISSGYNISGPEVENVLLEHPAVAECGVVGVPHEERGHVVKAFIVLRAGFTPSEQLILELQDHVKRSIAPYKYPRVIEFCPTLPRTNTGKLQRFRLRELEV